eukprot:1190553-Pyramimonas_sp.AAC.1
MGPGKPRWVPARNSNSQGTLSKHLAMSTIARTDAWDSGCKCPPASAVTIARAATSVVDLCKPSARYGRSRRDAQARTQVRRAWAHTR